MKRDLDPQRVAQAVRRAGRSGLDPRTASGAADLSPAAIAARRTSGDATGRDLIERAAAVYSRAGELAKVATRPSTRPGRRARANAEADRALMTAAVQIRLAQLCPLSRPYMHHLSIQQIQTAEAEVARIAREDLAALAVDTNRRVQEQRDRARLNREEPS